MSYADSPGLFAPDPHQQHISTPLYPRYVFSGLRIMGAQLKEKVSGRQQLSQSNLLPKKYLRMSCRFLAKKGWERQTP